MIKGAGQIQQGVPFKQTSCRKQNAEPLSLALLRRGYVADGLMFRRHGGGYDSHPRTSRTKKRISSTTRTSTRRRDDSQIFGGFGFGRGDMQLFWGVGVARDPYMGLGQEQERKGDDPLASTMFAGERRRFDISLAVRGPHRWW